MMRCSEVRPILSFFVEKETGPSETLQTRRHLDRCESCSARARHLSTVQAACTTLAEMPPARDLAASVMQRLRALRSAGGMRGSMTAPRWSGLALILGSMLALLSRPDGHVKRALSYPIHLLSSLLTGGDAAGSTEGTARAAAAVALSVASGARAELTAGAGVDLLMSIQVVATALLIGLLLAIPVAILTAWFLKDGLAGRQIPRI